MNFLFVSSVNLTTDPRIYKEVLLADKLGHQVTFIGFKMGNWSDRGDELIKAEHPSIKFMYLDATRKEYFTWLYFSLLYIFHRTVWRLNKGSVKLSAMAHSKRTVPLLRIFKRLRSHKYDLIIGHTLAALYPSAYFAGTNNCGFGFDVEDYHPGEKIESDIKNEKKRRETILQKILPSARYVTAASPLIAGNVEMLVKGVRVKTVLNYFPGNEFIEPSAITADKIKLVWFSQNINAGRGLEIILSGWKDLRDKFELVLIGKPDTSFYDSWIKEHDDIIVKQPVPQSELHKDLSSYDIGLAIDVDNEDYNRKLAITNKILAYYQAGLFIIATNTPAQQQFIQQHPLHGIITAQTVSAMQDCLNIIYSQKDQVRADRNLRFTNASLSSWERESEIINNEWQKIKQT